MIDNNDEIDTVENEINLIYDDDDDDEWVINFG